LIPVVKIMGVHPEQMRRLLLMAFCACIGALSFIAGWLVPAHLRAVDLGVIEQAGKDTPGVVSHGLELSKEGKMGAASLFLQAAQNLKLAGAKDLALSVSSLAIHHPNYTVFGGAEPRLEILFDAASTNTVSEPFADFIVHFENRERVLRFLLDSSRPVVQELLKSRTSTNTVLFPPASSSSGQAYDAALCICALLVENGKLSKELTAEVLQSAAAANQGRSSEPLESTMMDLLSLSQRLNWNQLGELVASVTDQQTLRLLSEQVRQSEAKLPVLFSAVVLTRKPDSITGYLRQYSRSGLNDIESSLRYGAGAITELLHRNQQVTHSELKARMANTPAVSNYYQFLLDCCWQLPITSLVVKWIFYMLAGFLLAELYFQIRPASSAVAAHYPVYLRAARNSLFSMGFLLVALLFTEPFLAQADQRAKVSFQLRIPIQNNIAAAGVSKPFMNKPTSNLDQDLMILALFFVLQALLYTVCLLKLAEIRRQNASPQFKLELLANEDHLFDAGLYLGFVGTIICLILATMGIVKPSLMAAYSSTSFGIVFVSVFKIFHLRQARRVLLHEINSLTTSTAAPKAP
jgi:hypothetical protein